MVFVIICNRLPCWPFHRFFNVFVWAPSCGKLFKRASFQFWACVNFPFVRFTKSSPPSTRVALSNILETHFPSVLVENPFPSICEPVAPLTWSPLNPTPPPHLCTFDFIFKVEKLLSLSLAGERSGKFSFQKASRRTVFTLESLPRPFLSFGADVTFPYVKLIEAYLVGILFCCWYDYQERKGKKTMPLAGDVEQFSLAFFQLG